MEENVKLTLSEKMRNNAEAAEARFREKHREDVKLPGYIRLLYSGAEMIDRQTAENAELKVKLQEAMEALSDAASCDTCKNGTPKNCPMRSECGDDRALWQFRGN